MKKLLLLVFQFGAATLSFATNTEHGDSTILSNEDSNLKKVVVVNPREGFKNLFENTTATNGFSGKLNPKAISFVDDYVGKHSAKLTKMKTWGKPYFDMMDDILSKYSLPVELKYLSVIESDLKSYAVSWAGAVGPWQFMPATAREMGLVVSGRKDERTDFTKSTYAAARYLTNLFGIYNDWLLVIAAYNCGPGNVEAAIRKSGSRNFWNLQNYLPAESRNHVKKFIATHYIMEGQGSVTTLTRKEVEDLPLIQSSVAKNDVTETITISGKYNGLVIAQFLEMNAAEFNRLNPGFDHKMAINNSYDLQLPADKALLFQAKKFQILEQSIKLALTMTSK
ncbi:MAG TPA: lytic transglycosylase domain-containing protein [Chitinophagaceae bacterium]|nr:lytic transglycosylase domain-containing protein [Chitinophagaceae bacterium]